MSEPQRAGGTRRRVLIFLAIAALVALAVGVFVKVGFANILSAFAQIGWRGLIAMILTYLPPVVVLAASWLILDAKGQWRELIWLYFARLVRDASGELLPFSSLGGYVFGARAAILGGLAPATAISTSLVDATAEFIGQLGYTAVGIGLLTYQPFRPAGGVESQQLLTSSLVGIAAGALAAVGFIALQRRYSGFIERQVAQRAPSALAQTRAGIASLHAMYDNPGRLIASSLLHFGGWILSAVGVWAGLWLAGIHMSVRTIVGMESLVYVVRTLTFAAPMGLGVIEAGYAIVGPMFGLSREFAVALSLIKRLRDIAIGLPALALWQFLEGHRAMRTEAKAETPEPE